jgi:hypothetical protein
MPLTGSQIGRIQNALLAAFDRNELRRVLRVCLEVSLDAVTSDKLSYRALVFELVEWADRAGRVLELLNCAHEDVPDNAILATVYAAAQGWAAEGSAAQLATSQPLPPAPAGPVNDASAVKADARIEVQPSPVIPLSPHARSLIARMQDTALSATARLEAGLRADALGALPPGLDTFIQVPGLKLRIGKYPVTNAQFKRFVDAGGYKPENEGRWWSAKGIEYKHQEGWTQPRFWDDRKWNRATQPVVGVCWYEAEAYCNWLDETRTGLRDDEYARLPTVAEWEAAARGGQPKLRSGAQDYPWRGPFDPARANTKESNLGQTTPVHMYPAGATPEGVCDLIGNVWEWTGGSYEAYRLVGGSYWNEAQPISAAKFRYLDGRFWIDGHGFRLVVVSAFP